MTKPGVTFLVVITTIPNMLIASKIFPSLTLFLSVLFGTALSSASAAIFNQIFESDVDDKMKRTKLRAIPKGQVSVKEASFFGCLLGLLGYSILFLGCNFLTANIALAGHFFYVFVYTMYLKRRTPQNIVIGGIAGAIGPLIGSAAVLGTLSASSLILCAIITCWTPPHFWALALNYKSDYAAAAIPMYPNVYGDDKTRKAMMMYSFLLIPLVFSIYYLGDAGMIYLVISMLFTLKFAFDALKLYRSKSNKGVMKFFHFSCIYMLVICAAFFIDWIFYKYQILSPAH